jgi:hypothetical protein
MTRRSVRWAAAGVVGFTLLLPLGCGFVTDLFNPSFFSNVGLDPNTIFPAKGVVIVSFTNNTDAPAFFLAYESVNALDLTVHSKNFSVQVDPGENGNQVLECTVALISPGSLGADFKVDDVAAIVATAGGTTDVTYTAAPLEEGRDYRCGDVIDIELFPVAGGTGTTAAYQITVRVIPG